MFNLPTLQSDPYKAMKQGSWDTASANASGGPTAGLPMDQMDHHDIVVSSVGLQQPRGTIQYEVFFTDTMDEIHPGKLLNLQQVNHWLATEGAEMFRTMDPGVFQKYLVKYPAYAFAAAAGAAAPGVAAGAGAAAAAGAGAGAGARATSRRASTNGISGGSTAAATAAINAQNQIQEETEILLELRQHAIEMAYLHDRFKFYGIMVTKNDPNDVVTTYDFEERKIFTCSNRGLVQVMDYWSLSGNPVQNHNSLFFIWQRAEIVPTVTKFQSFMTLNSDNSTGTTINTNFSRNPYHVWQITPFHCRDTIPPVSALSCPMNPLLKYQYIRVGLAYTRGRIRGSYTFVQERQNADCVARDVSYLYDQSPPMEIYLFTD